MALELFYIEDSHTFFCGRYDPKKEYNLIETSSLEPDELDDKKLNFSAVALRLGRKGWSIRNDGILSLNLNLTNPVVIEAQGPIKKQTINSLNFNFVFKQAEKSCAVVGINKKPIFRIVSAKEYLTQHDKVDFILNIGLAKSCGSNTNTILEMTSQILNNPAVNKGLIATVPFLGIASGIFEVIRTSIFSSDEARIIWEETGFNFTGAAGGGHRLKVGRYVFVSTNASLDNVVKFYSYLGGRLVDIRKRKKNGDLKGLNQFYLDIYAD